MIGYHISLTLVWN